MMAISDFTTYARLKNDREAISRSKCRTHPTDHTLADLHRAMFAVVRVMAHGVAERESARRRAGTHSHLFDARTIDGLSLTLYFLRERADAWCRPHREDPCA
jgi:hypothetical protein